MKAIKTNLFNYGNTMCVGNFKNLNKYCVSKVRKVFERKPVLMFANIGINAIDCRLFNWIVNY